jgi:hypothetical protein
MSHPTLGFPVTPGADDHQPGTNLHTVMRATELMGITGQVDPGAQAIVWGVTASAHAAEALTALAEQQDMRASAKVLTGEETLRLVRLIDYHTKAHAIADKAAGMWALINSTMPTEYDEADLHDESGEERKHGSDTA